MPSRVQWKVIKCTYLKYFKQNLSWINSRKMCSGVPTTMTFVSWTGGDMEWGFGGNTSLIDRYQRLISDKLGRWRLLWVLDGRKFVGCPNTFRPLTNETCWKMWTKSRGRLRDMELWSCNMLEKHRKWKMELTCDPSFRNQPSGCLFWTSTSAVRPRNLRKTIGSSKQLRGSLSLETGDSVGLKSLG